MSTTGLRASTVAEVVAALDRRYPPAWAEQWDRVGLVVGDPSAPVHRVLCVVDCVPETVAEAHVVRADLIVAHHPLLLRGVSSVAATTYKGRIVHDLIRNDMALHVAHTNADVADPGVSDALAARFGLTALRPLHPPAPGSPAAGGGRGIGRIGQLPQPMTLAELTRHAAAVLPPTAWGVRAAGDPDRMIRTLAVSGGSGDSFLAEATAAGVDAFLTADLRHHPASEHLSAGGPALLDAAHWATERPWLDDLAGHLRATVGIETLVSDLDTDPWTVHATAPAPPRDKEPREVKAEPKAQRRLLDLQAIDTALAQLAHRRRILPERAELEALARELSALEDQRVRAQVAVDDLDRDIARLEKDVDQVRARKNKDEVRLASGSGPARELEALQHEMVSLNRRQSELEDAELELMEQRETAQSALDGIEQRLAETREKRAGVERRRDESLAEIAKDEQFKTSSRQPLAADLPADLIGLYDKVREVSGGLGAALLRGGRCGGCRLDLSGADRARIRAAAPDEVVRCEECRRIMIRTDESGL